MAHSTVKDMTQGSPTKLILGFMLPLLLGCMFQQLYSFVDTAIVGRVLGAQSLAAVGSTGSVNFLILGFCMGMCSGFAIPVAQAFGAKDEKQLRACVVQAVFLCAVLSVIIGGLTSALTRPILQLMNTPESILDEAASYIGLIFAGAPITVMYNMAGGIMRSLGDSKTPVFFLAVASLINIVLDLFLMLVLRMGVAGAAVATLISQLLSGLGCIVVLVRRFPILHTEKTEWRFQPRLAEKMVGIGIPFGLQFSITAIGSVVIQYAVNGLGTVAIAAIAAASKVNMLIGTMWDSLATTMSTYCGQNTGAGRIDRVRSGEWAASKIGLCCVAFATLFVFTLGKKVLGLFISEADGEVIVYAFRFMTYNCMFFIPLLFVNILRLSIQGMGYTQVAMIAGVMEMIGRSAVALLLVPVMGFGGACLSNPVAWVMADMFLFPCFFKVTKDLETRLQGKKMQMAE